jgi:hypothetical protein
MARTGIALASSSGRPIVKTLAKRLESLLCSATGGTATSEMKSSTGQLRSAGFRTHSPKGSNEP